MIPEPRLKGLYQEVILDHNKRPRNFKELECPTCYSHGFNPLCGDDYHLYLKITPEGQIEDIGFKGAGCAISKSSASIMSSMVKGKSVDEARILLKSFIEFMTAKEVSEAVRTSIGRLTLFEGVREFPIRIKCATLIWHSLEDALNDQSK